MMDLKDKKICIIGLGYVGIPLAVAFAEKFKVIGYDTNKSRVQELEGGTDKTLEIDNNLLHSIRSNISYTSSINECQQ